MLKVLMKPPSKSKIRQLKQYKGTAKDLNRQRKVLSERQTEKINEQVEFAIGLFVTVAIGLGLVVGIMEMCAFVGEPIETSATKLTRTFEATNGMMRAALPTLLVVGIIVAFLQARYYYRQTDK